MFFQLLARATFGGDGTVKQPLPLPLGVPGAAVGGSQGPSQMVSGGSVPEPGAIGLISLLTVLLALQRGR